MRHFWFYILAAFCVLPSAVYSQGLSMPIPDHAKEWRRINTGQDSTIDIGVSTLVLEPNGILKAKFRIELSKAEDAPEVPGSKYKTQLLTIQFDSKNKTYRTFETTLLDSSDKIIYASEPNPSARWKPLIRSSSTYFTAATDLPPLGLWKVTSATDGQAADPSASVTMKLDRFQVGRNTCSLPSYESATMTREELAKLTGLSPNGIQTSPEKVNVLKIKCDSGNLTSETHILMLRSVDRAILLSGGSLFALER